MTDSRNATPEPQKTMREWLARLKTERDELLLKMHLANAEVRDEWQKVEEQWEHFKAKTRVLEKTSGEAGEDVAAAAKLLGEEINNAYRRIKESIAR